MDLSSRFFPAMVLVCLLFLAHCSVKKDYDPGKPNPLKAACAPQQSDVEVLRCVQRHKPPQRSHSKQPSSTFFESLKKKKANLEKIKYASATKKDGLLHVNAFSITVAEFFSR